MEVENLIVDTIIKDEQFARKVISYIKNEHFETHVNTQIFKVIKKYYQKYHKPVNRTTLLTILTGLPLEQDIHSKCSDRVNQCFDNKDSVDAVWLEEQTNQWIKKRAVYNGVMKAIEKINSGDNINDLPEIFKDALMEGFNQDIGFDIFDEVEQMYVKMTTKEEKIPFGIKALNDVTGGGNERKTITVIAAGCVHPDTLVRIRYKTKS